MVSMSANRHTNGFTLIEVLVIAPIVVILIGAFIALAVTLTGESLKLRAENSAAYNTQDALDDMETSVVHSLGFLAETPTLTSPQGPNDGSGTFTNTTTDEPDTLIIRSAATNKGPFDINRSVVYSGSGACNTQNAIYEYTTVFFVKNGSLYRRTILSAGDACETPWQRNSCSESVVDANPSVCQTEDEKLLDNVTAFDVKYYTDSSSSTQLDDNEASAAITVMIDLTVAKQVAGKSVSYDASVQATSLNNTGEETFGSSPPADIPPITWSQNSSASPYTITFQWEAVSGVTGYNIQYKIGSGSWTDGPQNTTNLSYDVTGAYRKQQIDFKLTAVSSGGNFEYGTSTATIQRWDDCTLANGWSNYNNGYDHAGFTKTSSKLIGLRGVVTGGSVGAVPLCTLPAGFRPSKRLIFQTAMSGGTARVDVQPNGDVYAYDANNAYVSLDGILFVASDATYSWTAGSWQNGWSNWGSPYSDLRYTLDSEGRVQVEGMGRAGTLTNGTVMTSSLSGSAYKPDHNMAPSSRSSSTSSVLTLSSTGTIYTRGFGSLYNSIMFVYYPGTFTNWNNLNLSNGWSQFYYSYSTGQCYKGADDVVIIRGAIAGGSNGSTIANTNTSGCGLSADGKMMLSGWYSSSSPARIDLQTNGDLTAIATNTTWTVMDSMHFIAD